MRIERRYTKSGQSPYSSLAFRLATSEIRNPDGSVVFKLENIEVPETWSQVASDVLAQKYFRKAGVPAHLKKVEENDVPSWLWRSGLRWVTTTKPSPGLSGTWRNRVPSASTPPAEAPMPTMGKLGRGIGTAPATTARPRSGNDVLQA